MSKRITKKSIIKYLDKLSAEGSKIEIKWEGGNDSGWVYLEIDGIQDNSEEAEAIVSYMDNTLDYGSWAGDFNADGYAIYNPNNKCFEGQNSYGEVINDVIKANIIIKIPDSLWFDRLILEIESNYDERSNVSFNLDVTNGFKTDAHETFEKEMQEELSEKIDDIIVNYNDNPDEKDIDRVYSLESINKSQFQHVKGSYIYVICDLNANVRTEETSDIILDLNRY